MKLLLAAVKNQATGHYILNGKADELRSRSFIDLGVEWSYMVEGDVETLHTDGPLHDPVVVLVIIPEPERFCFKQPVQSSEHIVQRKHFIPASNYSMSHLF